MKYLLLLKCLVAVCKQCIDMEKVSFLIRIGVWKTMASTLTFTNKIISTLHTGKMFQKIISCDDIGRQSFFPINIKQTAQWILITKCFRFYNYTFLCEHNIMLALYLYEKKYFGIFISSKSHFGCWHMHMAPTRKPEIGPPALGPASSRFIFISL